MHAAYLIEQYRKKLGWSDRQCLEVLLDYLDQEPQVQPEALKEFLRAETGVALEQDPDPESFRGQPFAVVAYGRRNGRDGPRHVERIDTESEVLAMEAFSRLLGRDDLEHFAVIQFHPDSGTGRALMRYDRRTSAASWSE